MPSLKVVEVPTSKTRKHGHAKWNFVAIDIFNGNKLIKDAFAEGKDLVTVMFAMGEDHRCGLKDSGSK
ncbi:hypothetical protein E3N88_35059 [Mikania micrantha]|uniref:Translation initiation factor 5A-like N-terminal domain-containing protein n=1 Tax=Mikania micrantha TaxID=192012 RepID=A0A5N6LZW5_9ASTR|nr:hypothetical protein E3N88_35059 [Mikania micrantha]